MAVTLSLFAGAGAQFFDNNGVILSGGKVYTYAAGTTTPRATYTTNSDAVFHTNPIVLDSAGRVPNGGEIWLQLGVGYKFVVKTSAEVLIATYDNIPSSAQPPAANDADSIMYEQGYTVTAGNFVLGKIYRIASVGTTNFTLIGAVNNAIGTHFIATGAGTGTGTAELSQTVETKLREYVSVKDFGAVGNGVTDDTAALQAAISACQNRVLFLPAGTYIVSQSLYLGARGSLIGEGAKASKIQLTHSGIGLYTRDQSGQIDYTRNQQYKNFGIVCNVNTTYGLWVVKALYCYFENVEITVPQAAGATFTAFRVAGSVYLNTFVNCVSDTIEEGGLTKHGGRGWWIGNGENEEGSIFAATNENTFITCRGQRANVGFDVDAANGAVLMTCGGETCTTAGIRLRGASYCQVISPWIEGAVVVMETTQQGNGSGGFVTTTPQNNTITPGRNFPLTITAAQNTTIVGGRLDSLVIGASANHTVLLKTEILSTLTDNGTYSELSYYKGGELFESLRYGSTEEYRREVLNSTLKQNLLNGDYYRSSTFLPFLFFSDRGFDFEGASGFLRLPTSTNIPAGATGKVALYVDTSGGKHRLMAIFPTGVAQQIAIEP